MPLADALERLAAHLPGQPDRLVERQAGRILGKHGDHIGLAHAAGLQPSAGGRVERPLRQILSRRVLDDQPLGPTGAA